MMMAVRLVCGDGYCFSHGGAQEAADEEAVNAEHDADAAAGDGDEDDVDACDGDDDDVWLVCGVLWLSMLQLQGWWLWCLWL